MRRVAGGGPSANDGTNLVALIREQVAAEVADIERAASEAAERTRAAAEAEAESLRAEARRRGEARGRRRAAELLAIAEADQRREWLEAREALIEDAMRRVREELVLLPTLDHGAAVLVDLLREALRCMPRGPVRVRMPGEYERLLDEAARTELAAGRWQLRFESAPVPGGGVVVETEDGELRFDNSFAARIRRHRMLRRRTADALLAAEAPPFRP